MADRTRARVAVPVVAVDDAALADLLLHADGLLTAAVLRPGGPVDAPVDAPVDHHGAPGRVLLPLDAERAADALAAGALEVSDAEGFPVVRLGDLVAGPGGVLGELARTGRAGAGPGRPHHLPAGGLPPADGHRTVVVLRRPLLDADEAMVLRRREAGEEVVLVVPVGGPGPDSVPPALLLRLAERSARRTGARLVAATLRWRDPRSDQHLVAHVARGLGAVAVPDHPGAGLPGDDAWTRLLADQRREERDRGRDDGQDDHPVAAEVLAALDGWRPPAARRGLVVLMSGLSGSGKSTLARALAEHVRERTPRTVSLLDGDHVRRLLSSGLGFGRADRELNVLRIGYVATEVARHGGVAVCAPIAPYAGTRAAVRQMVQEVGDLVLVHVSTPLEECERRDVKGLYARARAGEIPAFTGISDPYEEPDDADVVVDTSVLAPDEALDRVVRHLVAGGWLPVTDGEG